MMPPTRLHGRRLAAAAAVLSAIAFAAPAFAVSSRLWKQRERADFEAGEPKGVSLSVEGPIRLGARIDPIFEPDQAYTWALAVGPRGEVYAAVGSEGLVQRIEPGGKASPFLQVDEAEVHALAVDAKGAIYAGTAPGGRIYKFAPDGKRVWDRDTGERYVWALAFDHQGRLYAGTGTEGRVLRIDADGSRTVVLDSAETHIRALADDGKGGILAGSDGHGLVFRIAADGGSKVLYDGPLAEVAALQPAADGTVYAAFIGEASRGGRPSPAPQQQQRPPSGEGSPAEPPREGGGGQAPSGPDTPQTGAPAEQRVSIAMEGKVLAISPDGYAREVWSAAQEGILSLALRKDGALLMGSASQGRIYALDAGGGVSEVSRAPSSQVTALARRAAAGGRDEEVVVGGSNLGSVALLRPGYAASGSFESRTFDAQSFATWGRIAWKADLPQGTAITLQARSGNTENPDRTWSDWGAEMGDAEGSVLDLPAARFIQWRAALRTTDPARTPELREVTVVFLQKNLPPEFRKIEVLPPGVSLQVVPPSPGGSGPEAKPATGDADARRRPRPQSRRGSEPGARSVQWQVNDPNDDDLQFDVQFRALDETAWKTIRSRIAEDFVSFDGAALPDGTYLVRVVASDAPSNPAGQALSAEKVSAPFDVDNTPPRIEKLKASVEKGILRVAWSAGDGFSVLRDASYSIDAADWMPARPADGMHDASAESYVLELPAPAAGEHSIVVRVTDAAGNTGAGRIVVTIP